MAQASIDSLEPRKTLIDLTAHSKGNFSIGDDFVLNFVFDDIVLVEYVDEVEDEKGEGIMRDGIIIPTNALTKAWRKAKVVLAGPGVCYCKVGDIVIFPNDKGVAVANIEIGGYGRLVKGMFLNEQRLFGTCVKNDNTSSAKKSARK